MSVHMYDINKYDVCVYMPVCVCVCVCVSHVR